VSAPVDITPRDLFRFATETKLIGNTAFKAGDTHTALARYTEATDALSRISPPSTVPELSVGQAVNIKQGRSTLSGTVATVNGDGTADLILDGGIDVEDIPITCISTKTDDKETYIKAQALRGQCLVNKARCHFKNGDFTRASDDANMALDIDESNVNAHFVAGRSMFSLGNPLEARIHLLEAIRLSPKDVQIRKTLQLVTEQLNAQRMGGDQVD